MHKKTPNKQQIILQNVNSKPNQTKPKQNTSKQTARNSCVPSISPTVIVPPCGEAVAAAAVLVAEDIPGLTPNLSSPSNMLPTVLLPLPVLPMMRMLGITDEVEYGDATAAAWKPLVGCCCVIDPPEAADKFLCMCGFC